VNDWRDLFKLYEIDDNKIAKKQCLFGQPLPEEILLQLACPALPVKAVELFIVELEVE